MDVLLRLACCPLGRPTITSPKYTHQPPPSVLPATPPSGRAAQTPNLPLVLGRNYTFCHWARTEPGAPLSAATAAQECWKNDGGNYILLARGPTLTVTATWQRLCLPSFQVPGNATTNTAQCWLHMNYNATVFNIDDVTLDYVAVVNNTVAIPPPPPPPFPPPSPPPPPSPVSARINGYIPTFSGIDTNTSFEVGAEAFSVYLFDTTVATYNFNSTNAARTGSRGLEVTHGWGGGCSWGWGPSGRGCQLVAAVHAVRCKWTCVMCLHANCSKRAPSDPDPGVSRGCLRCVLWRCCAARREAATSGFIHPFKRRGQRPFA